MQERRKNRRIELNSHLIIKSLDEEMREVGIEISDVSKTGVGFISTEKLAIGTVYEAYLRIWTQEVLHAFLEIIRIEIDEEDSTLLHYGSTFVGMPELDASKISIYDVVSTAPQNQPAPRED